jgi:hypothetical protein
MRRAMKENNFSVKKEKNIGDALKKIELNGLGLVFIEDRKKIVGVITDGDIRRALIKKKNLNISLISAMNKKFTFLDPFYPRHFAFPFGLPAVPYCRGRPNVQRWISPTTHPLNISSRVYTSAHATTTTIPRGRYRL